MPHYGVIDLGSNSVRLVVYNVKNDRKKTYRQKDFTTLLNNKSMAGLAAYIDEAGAFTQAGVTKAVHVLKKHLASAAYFDCKRLDIFATAVIRNAVNCYDVLEEIEERIDYDITLLSCGEEAHLGYVGAALEGPLECDLLMDVGGGSTELTRIEWGDDVGHTSIPQGSLSSFATCVSGILPTRAEIACMREVFEARLDAESLPFNPAARGTGETGATMLGTGGSVRAAAKLYRQVTGEEEHERLITRAHIDQLIDWSVDDPVTFARTMLRAAPARLHTVVPGCVLIATVMDRFEKDYLRIAKYGVREGYLVDRMLDGK